MTRIARIGDLRIGGGSPILLQTMYDRPLGSEGEDEFRAHMISLKTMGCDIMRFSYPRREEHDKLVQAVRLCPMPVVADIHFDYRNAIDAIRCNVAKIRINPGNIGPRERTMEVARAARLNGCAIRIGLNSGSLPRQGDGLTQAQLMVRSALEYVDWLQSAGLEDIVVSLKASDVDSTIEAYKEFSRLSDVPLHLGITEAGGLLSSSVRSTVAFTRLLDLGIGDTLRYSICGSIEDEVACGAELLRTLGERKRGIRIIACPRCGRCSFDSQALIAAVQPALLAMDKEMTVAVMGCVVNGPGEAKNADIAISGLGNEVMLYKKGEVLCTVDKDKAAQALMDAVEAYNG